MAWPSDSRWSIRPIACAFTRFCFPSCIRSTKSDSSSGCRSTPVVWGESMPESKPTRAELLAAANKTVPDIIAPGLAVLFCGINPGLYTAAIGHHFGRPGNRFWTALHRSGFTRRVLSPYEEREVLELGLGITNIVNKATRVAEELTPQDLRSGGKTLERTIRRY